MVWRESLQCLFEVLDSCDGIVVCRGVFEQTRSGLYLVQVDIQGLLDQITDEGDGETAFEKGRQSVDEACEEL